MRVATKSNKLFSIVLKRIGNRSDCEANRIRRELNNVSMPILSEVVYCLAGRPHLELYAPSALLGETGAGWYDAATPETGVADIHHFHKRRAALVVDLADQGVR